MRNSTLIFSAALHLRASLQKPNRSRADAARRLDERLAQEEGETGSEQHQGDADGDVVDPRQLQAGVQQAEQRAGEPAASTPSQGEPGQVGRCRSRSSRP